MTLEQWLAYQQRQHPDAIALGLDRVRTIADRLGLTRPARHVITVGGTNGKGSTVAFVEAIARAAGLRVGAYTSPHLLAYNERVRIDGGDGDDAALIEAFEAIEAARTGSIVHGSLRQAQGRPGSPRTDEVMATRESVHGSTGSPRTDFVLRTDDGSTGSPRTGESVPIPLTYFEYGTLAALWLFARAGLDLAILEVGLGGRLDAVNIVDADVAIITSVDLDHQVLLGADRETIGLEKAGIMRAGKPVVLAEFDPPASVLRHAYAIGAVAIRAGCDYLIDELGDRWRWREVGYEIELPQPALAAPAQRANAAAAIAALRALDLPIDDAAIVAGVCAANVRGRLQTVRTDGVPVMLDVAHNPQAARQLAQWLAENPGAGKTLAVFSALADKDLDGIVGPLRGHVAHWWLCGLADTPRGLSAQALARRLAPVLAGADVDVVDGVAVALAQARAQAGPGDRVVVFGSFHTVADALRALVAD